MRVFENKVLRSTLELKREELIQEWMKRYNDELRVMQ